MLGAGHIDPSAICKMMGTVRNDWDELASDLPFTKSLFDEEMSIGPASNGSFLQRLEHDSTVCEVP